MVNEGQQQNEIDLVTSVASIASATNSNASRNSNDTWYRLSSKLPTAQSAFSLN